MPDKTIVQKPVVKTDLSNISLTLIGTSKTWNAQYTPKDETGAAVGTEPRVVGGPVTQDPGLWAWVENVVVAACNAQEGT